MRSPLRKHMRLTGACEAAWMGEEGRDGSCKKDCVGSRFFEERMSVSTVVMMSHSSVSIRSLRLCT